MCAGDEEVTSSNFRRVSVYSRSNTSNINILAHSPSRRASCSFHSSASTVDRATSAKTLENLEAMIKGCLKYTQLKLNDSLLQTQKEGTASLLQTQMGMKEQLQNAAERQSELMEMLAAISWRQQQQQQQASTTPEASSLPKRLMLTGKSMFPPPPIHRAHLSTAKSTPTHGASQSPHQRQLSVICEGSSSSSSVRPLVAATRQFARTRSFDSSLFFNAELVVEDREGGDVEKTVQLL